MSQALPGQHYCVNHQGNHSHYAEENCTVCVLLAALEDAVFQLRRLNRDSASRSCHDRAVAAIAKARGEA